MEIYGLVIQVNPLTRATIVAVGNQLKIKQFIGESTSVIDLMGGFVLPGFIDSYAHFITGSFRLSSVQLRDADISEEFIKRIADFANTLQAGTWIT